MKKMFLPAEILLPTTDKEKWAVVACDQYTSQTSYWEEVSNIVGEIPSSLNVILPELYLENSDVEARITQIHSTMTEYLNSDVLKNIGSHLIYLQRELSSGVVRHGLIGMVDLEEYSYTVGEKTLIRATEGTVLERIPPRAKVRRNAALESPHIMLLIDDVNKTVIEPQKSKDLHMIYDFKLMKNGGSVKGFIVNDESKNQINIALEKIYDEKDGFVFAVGDGNHSLATAKRCYEEIKQSGVGCENHPARYALVEVVNIHDEALEFEPIHRVMFEVDSENLISEMDKFFMSGNDGEEQNFIYIKDGEKYNYAVKKPCSNLAVGTLQVFLDEYMNKFGGKIDYIHGEDVVQQLASEKGNVGFLLPSMRKSDLFQTVEIDGVLPRKTFSMGHAQDKRFYLECRRIK